MHASTHRYGEGLYSAYSPGGKRAVPNMLSGLPSSPMVSMGGCALCRCWIQPFSASSCEHTHFPSFSVAAPGRTRGMRVAVGGQTVEPLLCL